MIVYWADPVWGQVGVFAGVYHSGDNMVDRLYLPSQNSLIHL